MRVKTFFFCRGWRMTTRNVWICYWVQDPPSTHSSPGQAYWLRERKKIKRWQILLQKSLKNENSLQFFVFTSFRPPCTGLRTWEGGRKDTLLHWKQRDYKETKINVSFQRKCPKISWSVAVCLGQLKEAEGWRVLGWECYCLCVTVELVFSV